MQPKWPHLAKNKLYDIKLQKYTRLIAKNGMIWRIGSSVFKILELAHWQWDTLYYSDTK